MSIVRSSRMWATAAAAVVVGVAVGGVARSVGGDACPVSEPGALARCSELVAGLSIRVGVLAGVAVCFMEAFSAALLETWVRMEDDRNLRAAEER